MNYSILALLTTVILTSNLTSSLTPTSSSSFNVDKEVNHLSKVAPKLSKEVLTYALTAYQKANEKGAVKKPVLTVIDYSMPSNKERMWVFDLEREQLLYNTFVAHGKNSGVNTAKHFSNKPNSKESSLGTFVTSDTYYGSKGYSLNLKGLERGVNDNAYNRRVVVHGAWYVDPSFIKRAGRAGLSWGCPAVSTALAKPLINAIKNGSVVFAYYPDQNYLKKSGYAVA